MADTIFNTGKLESLIYGATAINTKPTILAWNTARYSLTAF
jgi:hypothetical protein